MTDQERYRAFLDGLTALTKETRVEICACGCCESPWLSIIHDQDPIQGGYTAHDFPSGPHLISFDKEAKTDE